MYYQISDHLELGVKESHPFLGDLNIASTSLSWKGIKSETYIKKDYFGVKDIAVVAMAVSRGFIVGIGISSFLRGKL